MIASEWRIGIAGRASYGEGQDLVKDGTFSDRIQCKIRYFIPTGEDAAKALVAITRDRPVADMRGGVGEPTSFARASAEDGSGGPTGEVKLQAVVERIARRWQGPFAVRPVATLADLPAEIQDEARNQGSDGGDIRGVFHQGTISIMRENMRADVGV